MRAAGELMRRLRRGLKYLMAAFYVLAGVRITFWNPFLIFQDHAAVSSMALLPG